MLTSIDTAERYRRWSCLPYTLRMRAVLIAWSESTNVCESIQQNLPIS